MADNLEPNLDGDGSSYFQKAVVLRDWWLIKCSKEFNGKRFGVAGTEFTPSVDEKRAMRVFVSSPIIKAYDVFTLEASNGTSIVLRGFLNKERVVKSGFNPEISREFVFGFPPNWEKICNNCFEGIPLSNDTNTVPSSIIIDKARYSVLSPCKSKNTKGNVENSVAESRDKNSVTETNKVEINDKDGPSVGSIAENIARRKSLRLRSKSVEEETELELNVVENRTDGNGIEVFDKVNEFEAFDNVDVVRSRNGNEESMVSEERKDEVKVTTRASSRKKEKSKICENDESVVVKVTNDKRRKSRKKKSDKTRKIFSMGETKRKIDFDAEVTLVKEVKKKIDASSSSIGSLKRSRSGRLLVSPPLEYWRNQIPVYDVDRNLIEVKDGDDETPFKGLFLTFKTDHQQTTTQATITVKRPCIFKS